MNEAARSCPVLWATAQKTLTAHRRFPVRNLKKKHIEKKQNIPPETLYMRLAAVPVKKLPRIRRVKSTAAASLLPNSDIVTSVTAIARPSYTQGMAEGTGICASKTNTTSANAASTASAASLFVLIASPSDLI